MIVASSRAHSPGGHGSPGSAGPGFPASLGFPCFPRRWKSCVHSGWARIWSGHLRVRWASRRAHRKDSGRLRPWYPRDDPLGRSTVTCARKRRPARICIPCTRRPWRNWYPTWSLPRTCAAGCALPSDQLENALDYLGCRPKV